MSRPEWTSITDTGMADRLGRALEESLKNDVEVEVSRDRSPLIFKKGEEIVFSYSIPEQMAFEDILADCRGFLSVKGLLKE